ncbi:MAG: IS66 family transposase [Planctomycetaceae bacterium]|nr:IS66 family transposase [Planctomycetaceae bacterium]
MAARKPTYDQLAELVQQQAAEIERLQGQVRTLQSRLEDLAQQLREAHRQTAPFRRRDSLKTPDAQKKKPGRPVGHPGACRPRPEVIDQEVEVPLPECPHCQGAVTGVQKREQFVEEIPPIRPVCVKVTTWTGTCARCGVIESRHPLQTSTASGAAGTHLGPRAQALAVLLSHHCGLTMGRVCRTLQDLCGLKLTRGGLAQLLQRAAKRVQPLWSNIVRQIRHSPAVFADETSWYVGEPKWWLWIFTTPTATLYRVERGRGSDVVHETLGSDFSGMLVSDCLSSYDPSAYRKHKCIAHHLRALKTQAAALEKRGLSSLELTLWKVPLQDVIDTWKRREELRPVAYASKVLQLYRGVESLLSRSPPEPEEQAFRDRMLRQRDHLLGCLGEPAAEPTNNRAERDLRPAVIDRKVSCGNRTVLGKRAWEVLRSVTTTLHKQGADLVDSLLDQMRLQAE